MFGKKINSRIIRIARFTARGAFVATLALALSPVSAFAMDRIGGGTPGIILL